MMGEQRSQSSRPERSTPSRVIVKGELPGHFRQSVQFGEIHTTIIADTFGSWCAGLNAPSEEDLAMRTSTRADKAAMAGLTFAGGISGEARRRDARVTKAAPGRGWIICLSIGRL